MENVHTHPSLVGQLANTYRTARAEHAEASPMQRIGAMAALGGLAFEWGTGNEALIGTVAGNLHKLTDNPAITGLATCGVSFVEQGTIGVLMASTIHNFPKVASAVRDMVPSPRDDEPRSPSRMSRFMNVMILGSAVEIAKENARKPHTRRENISRAVANSAIIGTANSALIMTASAGIAAGAEHGFEAQAETAVDVISNPLTYVALLAATVGYNKIKNKIQARRAIELSESHIAQK